ncbi:MAG: ABC transporter substrate-binding protein [Gammaproteobacteria bacterium]|nr:MAG: ABC transporter substrate-binding protein [Gammaproteobacteria bacterium]
MTFRKLTLLPLAGLALVMLQIGTVSEALAAACPAVTVTKDMGIKGKFPQQFELAEFEKLANCTLSFSENPDIGALNAKLGKGQPKSLPPVADRLPDEPLVLAPYDAIGTYGGVFQGLSKATESGTSDLMSIRHVNMTRFSDDLATIVPNVAKSWSWNDDFTQLTFVLRKGHKWSDGAPFTSADVVFWYENMLMDKNVVKKPKDRFLVAGKRWKVEALDPLTVRFTLPTPKPGLLSQFAVDYAQAFQPKHFFGPFHPAINPDADKLAKAAGFENGYEVIAFYYGGSDWKDVPTPFLKDASKIAKLPAAVAPTLESHIVTQDTDERRRVVANPFFHQVDTQGNQLPYINEIEETYIANEEVQTLKMVNGEVDYKNQSVNLEQAPVLLQNQKKGNYTLHMRPSVGEKPVFSFNLTHKVPAKRALFNDLRFRTAMSIAIDREEMIETTFLGEGRPEQFTNWGNSTVGFITDKQLAVATKYDPAAAKKLLDEIGAVDVDGDGLRELPNGKPLAININFATQGGPASAPEIIAANWTAVGIKTSSKEVTTDEFRAAQSANELDVSMWKNELAAVVILSDPQGFIPPYGSFFGHRMGILWAQWLETNGAEGVEPPAPVMKLIKMIDEFQREPSGSDTQNKIGNEMVQILVDNLYFIGTVGGIPAPVYANNRLGNFRPHKAVTYDYYRIYPYRGTQWYLKK